VNFISDDLFCQRTIRTCTYGNKCSHLALFNISNLLVMLLNKYNTDNSITAVVTTIGPLATNLKLKFLINQNHWFVGFYSLEHVLPKILLHSVLRHTFINSGFVCCPVSIFSWFVPFNVFIVLFKLCMYLFL
jgi:hypothetical protein